MPGNSPDDTIFEGLRLKKSISSSSIGERLLLAWSPDGEWLASAFENGNLELWRTQNWTLEREFRAPLSLVTCVAWSPGGKMLAISGRGGVVLWNWEGSEISHSFNQDTAFQVNSVSWSSDGKLLACGTTDKTVLILDVKTQQVRQPLIGHAKAICSVAWSPREHVLASSGEDGSIRLWHIKRTGEQNRQSPLACLGHSDGVCALAWTSDGAILASASLDHTIRLWDTTGQQQGILEGLTGEVRSITFVKDAVYGQLLAVKVSNGTILLWRIDLREARVSFPEPYTHQGYTGLAFHPQLPRLVTPGESDTSLCIWDVDLQHLFEHAAMGQSVLYRNAKVVIIGNSSTGKSNLNLALVQGQAVKAVIPPQEHHIRLLEKQEKRSEVDGHYEVYETFLWDMDGRSGYRLIHQMYLHDVVVALIVLDAADEGKGMADIQHWVRALRASERIGGQHAPAIKRFLVITRADRGGRNFSPDQLQKLKDVYSFEGVFSTSASEGWGISELKKAILDAIDWDKLPEVSSTTFIQEIRDFLNVKREAGERLCDESELYEAFQRMWRRTVKAQDGDPRTQFDACIGRVEAQGLIRRLSFDSSVLLRPELFDAYASALLDKAKDDPDHFGSVDEVKALQGDFPVAEAVRIQDKRLERILLHSIVSDFLRYDIAFRERDDGPEQRWSLIFPSQSTQDNPDLPAPDQKYYIFRFEGDMTHLYTTLAVRLARSKSFVKKELWHNAITYMSEAGEMCGIYLQKHSETEGELTVFFDGTAVAAPQTQFDFTSYVYWHLKSRCKITRIVPIFRCRKCRLLVRSISGRFWRFSPKPIIEGWWNVQQA